jgi:hypothetical protein
MLFLGVDFRVEILEIGWKEIEKRQETRDKRRETSDIRHQTSDIRHQTKENGLAESCGLGSLLE